MIMGYNAVFRLNTGESLMSLYDDDFKTSSDTELLRNAPKIRAGDVLKLKHGNFVVTNIEKSYEKQSLVYVFTLEPQN